MFAEELTVLEFGLTAVLLGLAVVLAFTFCLVVEVAAGVVVAGRVAGVEVAGRVVEGAGLFTVAGVVVRLVADEVAGLVVAFVAAGLVAGVEFAGLVFVVVVGRP